MSAFLTQTDYTVSIKNIRLLQMIENDTTLLDDAEDTAIAIVRDALHSRYDVDSIFALTGAARPKQVVRWVKNLSLYFLYNRLPDNLIPERITKDYDDTLKVLFQIEDGKRSTTLTRLTDAEGVQPSKFRFGSRTARDHDIF